MGIIHHPFLFWRVGENYYLPVINKSCLQNAINPSNTNVQIEFLGKLVDYGIKCANA